MRLAVIVTHPIQYYSPLYQRLAGRTDLECKVFFTWHAGGRAKHDPGFKRDVQWDIPLTNDYDVELLTNNSRTPGSNRFWGIQNPKLVERVNEWSPDAVHITGYKYRSHLSAMHGFYRRKVPVLFRGDSHLLDQPKGVKWLLKKALLRRVYSWAAACLYVGQNNYDYYMQIGVPKSKLFYCPHCIDVPRFSEPDTQWASDARQWRSQLGIPNTAKVVLYAGKFEPRKRPLQLMNAVLSIDDPNLVILMVGDGPLANEVYAVAQRSPDRARVLSFQNQTRMPAVYRMGDIVALPSAFGETWGLAVNEAIACGRRVLLSDKVGGAPDLIKSCADGATFACADWNDFRLKLKELLSYKNNRNYLFRRAREFDISVAEQGVLDCLNVVLSKSNRDKFTGK